MLVTFTFDDYPVDFHPSHELKQLFDKGGEIARTAIGKEDSFAPMLIADTDDGFEMVALEAESLDSLLESATEQLSLFDSASRYLLVFEAEIETSENRLRSIVVEGAETAMAHGYRLCCISDSDPSVYHGHSRQLFG